MISNTCERCSRSFGILAMMFSEIFRSETLHEIISLLCSTIRGKYTIESIGGDIYLATAV